MPCHRCGRDSSTTGSIVVWARDHFELQFWCMECLSNTKRESLRCPACGTVEPSFDELEKKIKRGKTDYLDVHIGYVRCGVCGKEFAVKTTLSGTTRMVNLLELLKEETS